MGGATGERQLSLLVGWTRQKRRELSMWMRSRAHFAQRRACWLCCPSPPDIGVDGTVSEVRKTRGVRSRVWNFLRFL
jgi:hypothetical protein